MKKRLKKLRKWLFQPYNRWRDYPLQEGTELGKGRYSIIKHIGMGGYGITYKAFDSQFGRLCVLKQNRPSKDKLAIQLLHREAKVMRMLEHPNIPKVLDEFEEQEKHFLVMTYIDGNNMEKLLFDEEKRFTERQAVEVIYDLALMLYDLHRAGFVHLDVRIPNVLFNEEGVHLIDYGLADEIKLTENSLAVNHKEWLGPQSFSSSMKRHMRQPYPSSDWFSLGHFLLFLLYSNFSVEKIGEIEERPWEEELALSKGIIKLIHALLEADDDDETVLSMIRKTLSDLSEEPTVHHPLDK